MRISPAGCLVGAGIVACLAGGMYGVAATTANSMAATFATEQSDLHARRTESESSIRRASARYAQARGECESQKRAKRALCNAVARADEKRSVLRDSPTKETAP
jgi:hypothetical protein